MYMPLMIEIKKAVVFGGEDGEGKQKAEKLAFYADEVLVVPEHEGAPDSFTFGPGLGQYVAEKLIFDRAVTVPVHRAPASRRNIPRLLKGASFVSSDLRDRGLNELIKKECTKLNIPCNIIDTRDLCNAWFMSHIDVGDMLVAISSKAKCAFYSRKTREELQNEIERRGHIMHVLADFRERHPAGRERKHNLEALYASEGFQAAINNGNWEQAQKVADAFLALATKEN